MPLRVVVLMGGMSREREVSLSSGKGVMEALKALGYDAVALDVGNDAAEKLRQIKPDVAFNALHGHYGEDGCIQGMLEIMGIPYTHSGVLASSVAMNKPAAKLFFQAAGIPVVEGKLASGADILADSDTLHGFDNYVVKPIAEGSSVGVCIVMGGDKSALHDINPDEEYLIERYIPGREVQVAVMNGKALGAIEIVPDSGFYDYEAKYTPGKARHLMPAPIHIDAYKKICDYAVQAHNALGCKGVTRSDFRYDDTIPNQLQKLDSVWSEATREARGSGRKENNEVVFSPDGGVSPSQDKQLYQLLNKEWYIGEPGNIYILEINTQPGMTPLSLTPEIANHAGISYEQLVDFLIKEALPGNRA